jgi:hypothetical protein
MRWIHVIVPKDEVLDLVKIELLIEVVDPDAATLWDPGSAASASA